MNSVQCCTEKWQKEQFLHQQMHRNTESISKQCTLELLLFFPSFHDRGKGNDKGCTVRVSLHIWICRGRAQSEQSLLIQTQNANQWQSQFWLTQYSSLLHHSDQEVFNKEALLAPSQGMDATQQLTMHSAYVHHIIFTVTSYQLLDNAISEKTVRQTIKWHLQTRMSGEWCKRRPENLCYLNAAL